MLYTRAQPWSQALLFICNQAIADPNIIRSCIIQKYISLSVCICLLSTRHNYFYYNIINVEFSKVPKIKTKIINYSQLKNLRSEANNLIKD